MREVLIICVISQILNIPIINKLITGLGIVLAILFITFKSSYIVKYVKEDKLQVIDRKSVAVNDEQAGVDGEELFFVVF